MKPKYEVEFITEILETEYEGEFITEILETESYFQKTPDGNMICHKPTKVRLKWVNTLFEASEILDWNWKMTRPWFACSQDHLVDDIIIADAEMK
jgi:hypothetical protein